MENFPVEFSTYQAHHIIWQQIIQHEIFNFYLIMYIKYSYNNENSKNIRDKVINEAINTFFINMNFKITSNQVEKFKELLKIKEKQYYYFDKNHRLNINDKIDFFENFLFQSFDFYEKVLLDIKKKSYNFNYIKELELIQKSREAVIILRTKENISQIIKYNIYNYNIEVINDLKNYYNNEHEKIYFSIKKQMNYILDEIEKTSKELLKII